MERDTTAVRLFTCPADACADGTEETRTSRREFLQTAGCFGMTLAVFGSGTDEAHALPVTLTTGTGGPDEKRYPIPASDGVKVDRDAGLILVRVQGRVFVFALACPHENYSVKWVAKDRRFQCTKHDSRYQPDGIHTDGRATRNMDRYVIRRDGDSVVVDLHHWIQSDKDPKGWDAASIAV
jgi:nitrite reductase/ring-hydroxylating ferredoxin subunit